MVDTLTAWHSDRGGHLRLGSVCSTIAVILCLYVAFYTSHVHRRVYLFVVMVSFQVNCISPVVYSLLTISDTGRLQMMSEQMEIIAALVASYFPSIVGQWLDVGCESPLDKQQERNEEDLRVYTDRVSGGRTRRSVWLRERRMVCRKRRQILDRRSPHSITSYQPHITHLIYLPLLLSPLPLLLSFLPPPRHAFLPTLHLLISSASTAW